MTILGTVGVVLILGFYFWMMVTSHADALAKTFEDHAWDRRADCIPGIQEGRIEEAAFTKVALRVSVNQQCEH